MLGRYCARVFEETTQVHEINYILLESVIFCPPHGLSFIFIRSILRKLQVDVQTYIVSKLTSMLNLHKEWLYLGVSAEVYPTGEWLYLGNDYPR